MSFKKLVLFDIDGTLLWPDGAGRAAMKVGLEKVYGTAGPIETYKFQGYTDHQTVFSLLRDAGLSDPDILAGWPHLPAAMEDALAESIRERRHKIEPCPGAHDLIAALIERGDLLLGLVTGNFRQTAVLKLHAAGFDPDRFRVGAYGDISADRADLPPVAVEQAFELTGQHFNGHSVVILGDTPSDMQCGHKVGARSIAVLTGWVAREAMEEHHPDAVFEDLRDTQAVVASIMG